MVSATAISAVKQVPINKPEISIFQTKHVANQQYPRYSTKSDGNNVQYRLYIDSSNDTLSYKKNAIDFNYGIVAKNKWYNVELPLMVFNYADFGVKDKNHNALISALGNEINIKYRYAFNMWDSKWGWRYSNDLDNETFSQGKEVFLKSAEKEVILNVSNKTEAIQQEKSDTNTEECKIEIKQIWNDYEEKFSINAVMGAWYNWKWGSIYKHATLTKFSYEGLDGSTSLKIGNEAGQVSESLDLSKSEDTFDLDDIFDEARNLYDKKRENGWIDLIPIILSYGASGYNNVPEGDIFSLILMLNNSFMLRDITLVESTNVDGSGKLKFQTTQLANGISTNLYYMDLYGISHYVSTAELPIRNRNININFYGAWSLSYAYSTSSYGIVK